MDDWEKMKASVIIPAYNAESTIGECLKALEKQSFKDFEVIVVDDGSKDRTGEAAKGFKGVKVFSQKNAGPAKARNLGAKNAKGEIIIFTDSDCIPERKWVEEMLKPMEDSEVVGVQGTYKTSQKEIVARLIQLEIEQRHEKMAKKKYIDFMGTYSAGYRRKIFLELGGFDESYPIASGEDAEFSFRVNEAGYKMIFNIAAVVWHKHPDNFWKYLKIKFNRAFWRMKVYKDHKGKMMKDSYTSQSIKVQIFLGLVFILSLAILPFSQNATVGVLPIASLSLLIITTLPFAVWAVRRDFIVGFLSPPIILLRTAAFGLGIVWSGIKRDKK